MSVDPKHNNRSELLITVRERFRRSQLMPIADMHKLAAQDRPAKGRIWVSRARIKAPPEDHLREALFRAIDHLSPSREPSYHARCPMTDALGEWVGYRPGVSDRDPEPDISEEDKYHRLTSSISKDAPTILYVHGGGFVAGSPALSRSVTSRLAQSSKGRVFAVKYNLAPTNVMPSQLLDILVAYLSLINPPPGSLHQAVPAKHIIFAAESSGSAMILGATLFLLHIQRSNETESILFNGRPLPRNLLPAGHTILSPMLFVTFESPSFYDPTLMKNDILLPGNPLHDADRVAEPGLWPANPPRKHWSTPDELLDHPLIEPMLAPDEMWVGAPPVWLAVGGERSLPAVRVLSETMRRAKVCVSFLQFEKMCHIWFIVMPDLPSSLEVLRRWGSASRDLARTGFLVNENLLIQEQTLQEHVLRPIAQHMTRSEWKEHANGIRERNRRLPVWRGSGTVASGFKI